MAPKPNGRKPSESPPETPVQGPEGSPPSAGAAALRSVVLLTWPLASPPVLVALLAALPPLEEEDEEDRDRECDEDEDFEVEDADELEEELPPVLTWVLFAKAGELAAKRASVTMTR